MTTPIQRWAIALACTAAWSYATPSSAQTWSLVDLGSTTASALNESGQVVGQMTTGSGDLHAFVTGANGLGLTDLGTLGGNVSRAYGINEAGQVVGMAAATDGSQRAFVALASGGPLTDLGSFGGTSSYAQGINNQGQILVNVNGGSGSSNYVYTLSSASSQNITPTRYSGHYLVPASGTTLAINDSGVVIGSLVDACNCAANAYVFKGPGAFGIGSGVSYSAALDLNDSGLAVGYFHGASGGVLGDFAFMTNVNGGGAVGESSVLGSLGGSRTFARGINNLGVAVGESTTAGGQAHAFITGANGVGMTDLNDLIALSGGAYLTQAIDLNDRGQVLALGSDGHSYLLSPVPEPSTWFMMSVGILGIVGRTRAKSKVSAN